jgi:hypothetical protein
MFIFLNWTKNYENRPLRFNLLLKVYIILYGKMQHYKYFLNILN